MNDDGGSQRFLYEIAGAAEAAAAAGPIDRWSVAALMCWVLISTLFSDFRLFSLASVNDFSGSETERNEERQRRKGGN